MERCKKKKRKGKVGKMGFSEEDECELIQSGCGELPDHSFSSGFSMLSSDPMYSLSTKIREKKKRKGSAPAYFLSLFFFFSAFSLDTFSMHMVRHKMCMARSPCVPVLVRFFFFFFISVAFVLLPTN